MTVAPHDDDVPAARDLMLACAQGLPALGAGVPIPSECLAPQPYSAEAAAPGESAAGPYAGAREEKGDASGHGAAGSGAAGGDGKPSPEPRESPVDAIGGALGGRAFPAPRPRIDDDWQRAPWNRWSFQHVGELVPTCRVPRGDVPAWELPDDPVNLDGLLVDTSHGRMTLSDLLVRSETDGFVVLRRGRLVVERYDHGMERHSRHLLQSVSKSITGTLAGILAGRGELDVGAPLEAYVPELRDTSFEGATVRNLLDMSTGTLFSEDYDDPEAEVNRYESAAGWRPPGDGPADLLAYMRELKNVRRHGEVFEYRSILTDMLAIVLERAAGRRFGDALSALLWSQLGAEYDAEITVDSAGYPMADGGISVTVRDLARFGQLILQGGCVQGRQVVPAAFIVDTRYADDECWQNFHSSEESFKLALCEPAAEACYPKGHYRNQWWVPDPHGGVLLGSGIYGQCLYIDLFRGIVIAKVSSQPVPFDADLSADVLRACAAVATALSVY